jgi:hypothetical protein
MAEKNQPVFKKEKYMAIINPGDNVINESQVDGTELARRLERFYASFHSQNSSTARPPAIGAGGLWSKTVTGGFDVMLFDGANDVKIGSVINGTVMPQDLLSADVDNYSILGSDNKIYTPAPAVVDLSAYDTAAVAEAKYVNVTGDTMTGPLIIKENESSGNIASYSSTVVSIKNSLFPNAFMSSMNNDGYAAFLDKQKSGNTSFGVFVNGRDLSENTVAFTVKGYGQKNAVQIESSTGNSRSYFGIGAIENVYTSFNTLLYADTAKGNYNIRTQTVAGDKFWLFEGGSGNAVAAAGLWVDSSDARNKENISPLESDAKIAGKAVDLICALNPVSYNRIGVAQKEIGFIAQEVAEVLPDVMVPYTYSTEPNDPEDSSFVPNTVDACGLNYNGIIAYQAMAIKELAERIAALEAK